MNAFAFNLGIEAGLMDDWIISDESDIIQQLKETIEICKTVDVTEIVSGWMELWEQTDYFWSVYGRKLKMFSQGNYDLYYDLKLDFWEGFLTGLEERDLAIYEIAKSLVIKE